MRMKTALGVLTAIVAAGTSLAVAVAAAPSVIASYRRKRYRSAEDFDDGDDGSRTYYDVPNYREAGEPDSFEMGSGAILKPDEILLEAKGANRMVVLRPKGVVERYEDGKLVDRANIKAWPEGEFKVHIVFLSNVYWLFFEKFHTACFDGIKMEPGYYEMDYVMALSPSFEPLSLSGGCLTTHEAKSDIFIGKRVVLNVPEYVRSGDVDRTIKSFMFFGDKDDAIYRCNVEETKVHLFLRVKEGYGVELVENYAIVDLKDRYMIYYCNNLNNATTKYYEDCFGEHNFARFKQACINHEVGSPFYRNYAEDIEECVIVE